jgi:Flp pilus assembly protein TadG
MRGPKMLRSLWREESGQGLVVATLVMVVVLGFAAMAIDVGLFLHERRELQKSADAAALAGAQELPYSPADAEQKAQEWAENNGIGDGELEAIAVTTTYADNDTITVEVKRDVPFVFARVLGLTSDTVRADATARVGSPAGMSGLVPWAVEEEALEAEGLVTLEFGSPGGGQGNFGGIVLDQPGGNEYEENIQYGADQMLCSVNQIPIEGCDTQVRPQPGNQAQIIAQAEGAVVWRMENTSTSCGDFGYVFDSTGDGDYQLNPDCDPFRAGVESCDEVESCLVIPVVVIEEFPSGASEYVDVQTFAVFFLEYFDADSCSPGQCEVQGQFVRAHVSLPALLGSYDPDSSFRFVRLVE